MIQIPDKSITIQQLGEGAVVLRASPPARNAVTLVRDGVGPTLALFNLAPPRGMRFELTPDGGTLQLMWDLPTSMDPDQHLITAGDLYVDAFTGHVCVKMHD